MKDKIASIAQRLHPTRVSALAAYLLKDEAISGKLIILATIVALVAVNTGLFGVYNGFLHTDFTIGLGDWSISKDVQHWINEGLMAIFFLVVGLELKRELVKGELRKQRTATLPFVAALGGMIVPALIYVIFNQGTAAAGGWAIPMATDIAFAIGVLALLGKRVPSSIRLFLLTLAIVDDIGAVIVIALFYTAEINPVMLFVALGIVAVISVLNKSKLLTLPVFSIAAIGIWLAIDASGVHASIAGVIIGLLAPLTAFATHKKSIAERMERAMIPLSTLVVVPIFALANTGIVVSLSSFQNTAAVPLSAGIILGLVIGKVVGIAGAAWLVIKLRYADLPVGADWRHIVGVGLIAGIGFTVAIFITELAFISEAYITTAKMSIFVASILSGVAGFLVLKRKV